MRGRDITVNAVAPGPPPHRFPRWQAGRGGRWLEEDVALERLGEPKDIREAVAFLAGPARWVNGQIVYVNGGVI